MSVVMGVVSVPGNGTVAAFSIPPGLCNFTMYQPTAPQAVYVGTSPRVSATSGMLVPVTPAVQDSYVSSGGATYYATTGNGTASTFFYLISTAS